MSGVVIPYTRRRGGTYCLKLPIPAELRAHFPSRTGRPRSHIEESLGTSDALEARRRMRERQAQWELHFEMLRRGQAMDPASDRRRA
jgi:hypothetical protein